ncbi:DUF2214 domain-containing protein [Pseudoroseomonas rhizosphaerae]|uniref:DUF2214 domain-containing protein n=1 Tax=Teichococcus rhizosphaerae TaxID=1335062 RepID=A0A2C6ZEC3_9PROT|nr:DUF6644 family protein [Pseudoroseomonas rhizosphaerae]PHK96811.1 DUF2214 domain-containing protein [Pseudoroseomonas rhizosphaerae]
MGLEWIEALAAWPGGALRRSAIAYPLANAAHILAIGLLLGAIATLDMRLLGAFRAVPLAHLAGPLSRVAGWGLALALATGLLLFSVSPGAYLGNPAFQIKLALVLAGTLNALALHRGAPWRRALAGGHAGAALRVAALLSLLLWSAAVLAGRWIGFL